MKNVRVTRSITGNYRISFDCPGCEERLRCPLSDAGKDDNCPECGVTFTVPGAQQREEIRHAELRAVDAKRRVIEDNVDAKVQQRAENDRERVTSTPRIPPTPQPNLPSDVLVTTGDLKEDYEVIGPVYFQVSNKGIFSSALSKLAKQYEAEIAQMKKQGQIGQFRADWGFLYGEYSVGQTDFEKAFYIAVQELKKRATLLGAHAVISMRQDIDLDTNTFQFFYLQMYGTAVRFR